MAGKRKYNHQEAIDLYAACEWPTTQIAKLLGVHHSSICAMLVRNGIKMRTIGRRKGVKYANSRST